MRKVGPLPTKCWEAFLLLCGYKYSGRTKGSHYQWTQKGYRTIPVWSAKKEIPLEHLQMGCISIWCSMKELFVWAEKNC